MNIVKKYLVYFSPTGSTRRAVELVGSIWGMPESVIDLSDSDIGEPQTDFGENELCIVGVPSYGGRVPAIALNRMKNMAGKNTPVILIAVYGNRAYDDTLLELKSILERSGFVTVAAMAVVAEHSIMPKFAAGRPNEKDKADILQFTEMIKNKLAAGLLTENVHVNGNVSYRNYTVIPFKPRAGRKCVKCGICASKCPLKAIPKENPKETDTSKCIVCMRCVKLCPTNARKINPLALSVASKMMEKTCGSVEENKLFI